MLQRPLSAWTQPLTFTTNDQNTYTGQALASNGLPQLRTSFAQSPRNWPTVPRDGQQDYVVHPTPPSATVKSRPVSAGARRASLERTPFQNQNVVTSSRELGNVPFTLSGLFMIFYNHVVRLSCDLRFFKSPYNPMLLIIIIR